MLRNMKGNLVLKVGGIAIGSKMREILEIYHVGLCGHYKAFTMRMMGCLWRVLSSGISQSDLRSNKVILAATLRIHRRG